ncbi:MAG: AAA family ATPase [Acidobacteriia bacterium]|nr:AAA family ATPase [Terriglobia bacterium]
MYRQFFGLRASPFNVNPDPQYLCLTKHAREALACLSYGIQARKGFILLTGEVGTGKTTLINKLLTWLRTQRVSTAFVFNPRLNVTEFFEFVLADFGIASEHANKAQMLIRLNHWLLDRYRIGETAALIIDEAQNLSVDLLEEIRLLTNLETSTEKLLQIVLSGQPELEEKLRQPELRQLKQRITLRCRTHPLTLQETIAYINQRLRTAGANGAPIFAPEAVEAVFKYAQGIPRIANLLCEHALINAFIEQKRPVTADLVGEVAQEFELQEPSPAELHAEAENVSILEGLKMVELRRNALREAASAGKIRKESN